MLHSAAHATEGSKSVGTADMLVCTDREAAADIPAILADLEAPTASRARYERVEINDPRLVKIRLDGYSKAYLVPLANEPGANVAP